MHSSVRKGERKTGSKSQKNDIVKMLAEISGRYNYHIVFQDWVQVMALSIQNNCCSAHDRIWGKREQSYLNVMNKYTQKEKKMFSIMLGMLVEDFEEEGITDVLGEIYMSQDSGNNRLGQFFTPFHISEMCARLVADRELAKWDGKSDIDINEPSTGGGGMLIAMIKILKERGIEYWSKVNITARDLDWNSVYMTYVQLSLLGARATVIQGDTLCNPSVNLKTYPPERVFYTPARKGLLI